MVYALLWAGMKMGPSVKTISNMLETARDFYSMFHAEARQAIVTGVKVVKGPDRKFLCYGKEITEETVKMALKAIMTTHNSVPSHVSCAMHNKAVSFYEHENYMPDMSVVSRNELMQLAAMSHSARKHPTLYEYGAYLVWGKKDVLTYLSIVSGSIRDEPEWDPVDKWTVMKWRKDGGLIFPQFSICRGNLWKCYRTEPVDIYVYFKYPMSDNAERISCTIDIVVKL